MLDPVQLVLISSIVVLTLALLAISFWALRLLRQLSRSAEKLDRILTDTQNITASVIRPLSELSQLASGIKTGLNLLSRFLEKKKSTLLASPRRRSKR